MVFLTDPLPGGLESLIAIDVTENVSAVMKVTVLCGFSISIPYIAFEIWMFFAPALSPASRAKSLIAIPLALMFFLAGMSFAYFIMMPVALPFLFDFMDLNTQPRPSSYFSFITAILFWIGIFFEFPLVAFVLARFGILRSETLKSQWRLAVIIIAVLAAAVTPTVDPINMGIVMAPMLLLYILAIVFAAIAQKRRLQRSS
jgi:sec-independent protein translocase protein TatC